MMLDTIFQHLGTVQCALLMWLGWRNLYLIKETIPYFLFNKYRIFVQNQLSDLFLKYIQYFRIPWWCVWRFLKILFTWLVVQETCVSRRNIFFEWIFLFVKYIFKRDFGKYIYEEYFFQYISEKNIWFKYMCIQKKNIFPMDIFICKIYFQKRFWEIYFLKNICFNIFLKRIFDTNICLAYDEKTHALNGYIRKTCTLVLLLIQ